VSIRKKEKKKVKSEANFGKKEEKYWIHKMYVYAPLSLLLLPPIPLKKEKSIALKRGQKKRRDARARQPYKIPPLFRRIETCSI
jgi:hypothetical protein